ncbi:MAG TPA: ATP-binding protein, partial [Nannocystaceae bacterium]|nr:ATP-binding protein [Nannocystaceae bacterium]
DYDGSFIVVLDAVTAIRRRPGMYVGDVRDGTGMHRLLWHLVDDAIDEHRAGHANRLRVAIEGNAITVEHDGRGLPVLALPDGRNALEVIATESVARMGLPIVNALCCALDIDVATQGRRVVQSFTRGRALHPQRELGETDASGTRIRCVPDFDIFARRPWARDEIATRLQALAWLVPTLRIVLDGRALSGTGGLSAWVDGLAARHGAVGRRIDVRARRHDVDVEIAMQWCASGEHELHAFVGDCAIDSGSHIAGFHEGLTAGVRSAVAAARPMLAPALLELVRPGLVAVVRIGLDDPRFRGPTRARLDAPVAALAVREVVAAAIERALAHDPRLLAQLRDRFAR